MLPDTLCALSQLQYLNLGSNLLSGNIPDLLSNLTQLQYFDVSSNELSGAIPESPSSLHQLQYCYLFENYLTGTIPASLSNLVQLRDLVLYVNHLNGTIPASLSSLTQLTDLGLDNNALNGSIPASLGNLLRLEYIYVYFNYLSGTIPDSLGNMIALQGLYSFSNRLTGTIPSTLGNLVNLQAMGLYFNRLNGSIPEALGNLNKLVLLHLFANQLTGTIPNSLGNLVKLRELELYSNHLIGSIPSSLGKLSELQDIYLYSNALTGTIPSLFSNLTQLLYLRLNGNKLTGSIPESLGNLVALQILTMDNNLLTGPLPNSVGALPELQFLDLSTNHLTGTIPYIASRALQQLELSNNYFYGNIPSFALKSTLRLLLLNNNRLAGNLDGLFDPTTQLQVESIGLANNQLTGTIPEAILKLNIENFIGTSNCFKGPLPVSAICNNINMVSFIIDGLSSASSCHHKLFVGPLSAYSLEHALGGALPFCLFQLPNLTTLHLSGNGFTGSIPSNIVLSDTLTDLSLSHNLLTGGIPQQLQLRNWNNIDLSYNRLSGTLLSHFASKQSVTLDNNRISGAIPASFRALTNLSVLGSNTFSCDYDQSDLPTNDPGRQRYHCGSNSFDVLYYIWLVVAVCTGVFLGHYEIKHKTVLSTFSRDVLLHDTNLYLTLKSICRISLCCALYSVVILLPLYAACSVSYGTQTYAYAYQISAVYMSGVVPFALDWCFWWIFLAGIKVLLSYAPTVPKSKPMVSEQPKPSVWQRMFVFVPYLLIDIIVVAGVNAAYVYVAVYKSSSLLFVVQTLLSIFKVVWSRLGLPYILTVLTQQKKFGKIHVFTQVVVNLMNNILIPCLIVAVVSPNCFYNALVAAPLVTSIVSYKSCVFFNFFGSCEQYEDLAITTSFAPPLSYNFQCSSSSITYYSPAFVSMCIVSTFVTPLAQFLCQYLHKRATRNTLWYRLLDRCLPRIVKLTQSTADNSDRRYLNIDGLLTTLISMLGLVLTFGAMFPPLCVGFAVNICATVFFFRRNVSNVISTAADQNNNSFVVVIKAECNSADALHILKGSVWLLITVSCWFYTLFLFDTLGDAVGFERAYWVLIVMPLMPLVLYVLYTAVGQYLTFQQPCSIDGDKQNHNDVPDVNIEMQSTANVHNVLVIDQRDSIFVDAVFKNKA